MLGLTIAALLLVMPSTPGNARPAQSEARSGTEVMEWKIVRKDLEDDAVRIRLSESYREQMEAYRRRVAAYREEIAAFSGISVGVWTKDEPPPPPPPVSGELPMVSVHMERNTKTSERHGLLRLQWDRRETANVDLLEINPNLYVVVGVSGSSSIKAPRGDWRLEHENVPDFYPRYLHPGRALIQGDVRGDLK